MRGTRNEIGRFRTCPGMRASPIGESEFDRAGAVCYVFQRIIMTINIFKIIADADIVVQLILLLLVFFSVFSWAIIFFKHKTLKSASRQSDRFLEAFRRSKSLTEVNESAERLRASPLAVIFLPRHQD